MTKREKSKQKDALSNSGGLIESERKRISTVLASFFPSVKVTEGDMERLEQIICGNPPTI